MAYTKTPTHASTHATGGSDPITPAAIGAASTSHTHTFASLTSKPTTLAGYGIILPAFLAGASGLSPNESVSPNVWQKLVMPNSVFDNASNYSTSLSRFSAPRAGFGIFQWQAQWLQPLEDQVSYYVALFKNQSELIENSVAESGSSNLPAQGTATVPMAAADYVEVYVLHKASTTMYINANTLATFFSGVFFG